MNFRISEYPLPRPFYNYLPLKRSHYHTTEAILLLLRAKISRKVRYALSIKYFVHSEAYTYVWTGKSITIISIYLHILHFWLFLNYILWSLFLYIWNYLFPMLNFRPTYTDRQVEYLTLIIFIFLICTYRNIAVTAICIANQFSIRDCNCCAHNWI